MRILEAVDGSELAGPAAAALAAARELLGRGHQITWLCEAGSPVAAGARQAGLAADEGLERSPFRTGRRIRGLAAEFDSVHVHGTRTHLAALLGLGFDRRARPVVRTCHAARPGELGAMARWVLGHAEALAVPSQALAFELRGAQPRGEPAVIPGGVDARAVHPGIDGSALRRALGLDGRLLVGAVASLEPGRRLLQFLEAAQRLCRRKEHEQLCFLVLGRGSLGEALARWIKGKKLADRIRLHDPGEKPTECAAALDIGVRLMPGQDGGASSALLLAALGKPLVAGRAGVLIDLVGEGGECGRLVSPDDPDEIAAGIAELAVDGERRTRLGAAARARVERDYTCERLGERYDRLFASLRPEGAPP